MLLIFLCKVGPINIKDYQCRSEGRGKGGRGHNRGGHGHKQLPDNRIQDQGGPKNGTIFRYNFLISVQNKMEKYINKI